MRIALVESNKQLIKTIHRYLDTWSTLSQYEKPTFLQFADELQFLSGYYGSIDLIVADVQLPHMDGIEFMRRLRVYDLDTPVILLSDNGEAARLGYRYNVFDYLLKPVDANELFYSLQRAAAHLRSRSSSRHTILCEGIVRRPTIQNIMYIEVLGHFLLYHVAEADGSEQVYKVKGQLKTVEPEFLRQGFFRVNRSFLVNGSHATRLTRESVSFGQQQIVIARSKRVSFRTYMAEKLNIDL